MNSTPPSEPLHINLLSQFHQPHKVRKLYLALAILVPVLYFALLLYEFSWVNLGMGVIFTANAYFIYSSSSNKDPLGVLGKSYISINEQGIRYKAWHRKPMEVLWQNVQLMQLHLFSVEFELKDGQRTSIPLEQLSDENLQVVKERLRQVQAKF